jgi:FHS family glucose/mannose:H+ symporter-like MFS transporter
MNRGETEVRAHLLTPTAVAHFAFVPTGILTILLGPLLPSLEARWSLNDAQAGELFTSQFLASTVGVGISGMLVPRLGYRVVLVLGLACMGLGVGMLPLGSWAFGMASVACFGAGLGLVIPTANLLVAEENPQRKASALSLLNFSWSVGAVACPFLLTPFQQGDRTSTFLFALAVAIAILALFLAGVSLPRPAASAQAASELKQSLVSLTRTQAALMLGALFFLYVGTESAVGGWLASYAKRITNNSGTMWVATPSFFYGALLVGRALAPIALRRISDLSLARLGLSTALLGVVALVASGSLVLVLTSAMVIGLGFSAIYPITIALLSHKFGTAATRLGSVMFALAGFGGASVPWLVGFFSTELSSLKMGLIVPAAGCAMMLTLYLRNWQAGVRIDHTC